MIALLKQAGRTSALWAGMIIGTIVSGIVVHPVPHPGIPDGPMPVFAAMLLVTGLGALVVAVLASHLTAGGIRKAALLFVLFFALETGLSWIEALAFNHFLGLTPAALAAILGGGLIRAAATAAFATLLWPRAAEPMPVIAPGLLRLGAIVILYVTLYFAAGFLVAWRSAAVRAYYQGGVGIDTPALFALQVGRGLLWTSLAWLLAARLRGRPVVIACYAALAFAVLMVAPLLYPNAIMPWAVRQVHFLEVALSNAAFGLAAVLLLRRPARADGASA